MIKRLVFAFILLIIVTPCLRSQKKEISQARSYIKSGKDLAKAENLLVGLLKSDSLSRTDLKVHLTLFEAVQKQYQVENEKLYLNQKSDTAAFFNNAIRMFEVAGTLDSLDAVLDDGKKLKKSQRRKITISLASYRPNLYFGGIYFMNKKDYERAFLFFNRYIESERMTLQESDGGRSKDSLSVNAACLTALCGFKLSNPQYTLKHSDLALANADKKMFTLKYISEAYLQNNDTLNYLQTLQAGFRDYPLYDYFFPRLVEYYSSRHDYNKALEIADYGIRFEKENEMFLYAKSTILLNMGLYNECIGISDTLISVNPRLSEPYFNAGTAFLNLALEHEKKDKDNDKVKLNSYYSSALPYLERYRELEPDKSSKWGILLYRIYFNLNMGKQFDEIDKLLKRSGKSVKGLGVK